MVDAPKTTNMECVVAVLAGHRAARTWTDEAVATEILKQLGLKPDAVATNAVPQVVARVTDDQIMAAEAAREKATNDLAELHAKRKAEHVSDEAEKVDAKAIAEEQAKFEADAKAADAARVADIRAMQAAQVAAARPNLANPPSGVHEPRSNKHK